MPADDSAAESRPAVPTCDAQTETPTCGASETWAGTPCPFPVDTRVDRCYVHDEAAPWPADDLVAFVERATVEPPDGFRAVVAQAEPVRGGLLVEPYVYYVWLLDILIRAIQLAHAVTEEIIPMETLLDEGVFREANNTECNQLHPALHQCLRASRRVRQLRKDVGLTAHANAAEPVSELESLVTGERE